MTAIATTIAHQVTCPEIVVNNTTEYPLDSTHSLSNFTEYVRYYLTLPNGFTVSFLPSQYPNQVEPPADSLSVSYKTCLIGKFTANYIALPTPPDSPVEGQSALYEQGDNFYFDGVIYQVDAVAGVTIPSDGFTNQALIDIYLATIPASISVITEDEIASKYKAELTFISVCTVDTCLLEKLEKLNCLIVKEPTRNDICEMKLYEEVLQLNFLKYGLDNADVIFPNSSPEEILYDSKIYGNYVNSICCCQDKKCDC